MDGSYMLRSPGPDFSVLLPDLFLQRARLEKLIPANVVQRENKTSLLFIHTFGKLANCSAPGKIAM